MSDVKLMLNDFRLTTAEILYHLPDHHDLLQTFIWQELDRIPDLPRLNDFLKFWQSELDGPLHSVRVAYVGVIQPTEWRYSECHLTLH
ncbi:MAG: usg protein [Rhodospirillales bacterium]|nr:usg protein [Rhodospirillales bacterium]